MICDSVDPPNRSKLWQTQKYTYIISLRHRCARIRCPDGPMGKDSRSPESDTKPFLHAGFPCGAPPWAQTIAHRSFAFTVSAAFRIERISMEVFYPYFFARKIFMKLYSPWKIQPRCTDRHARSSRNRWLIMHIPSTRCFPPWEPTYYLILKINKYCLVWKNPTRVTMNTDFVGFCFSRRTPRRYQLSWASLKAVFFATSTLMYFQGLFEKIVALEWIYFFYAENICTRR